MWNDKLRKRICLYENFLFWNIHHSLWLTHPSIGCIYKEKDNLFIPSKNKRERKHAVLSACMKSAISAFLYSSLIHQSIVSFSFQLTCLSKSFWFLHTSLYLSTRRFSAFSSLRRGSEHFGHPFNKSYHFCDKNIPDNWASIYVN